MAFERIAYLYPGEFRTGLWCHQCALPSVVRLVIHMGSPDSDTTSVVHYCADEPTHVLIEE